MAFGAIITTIITIATVTSAVLSVIQAFTPPKPSKITFGLAGDQGGSPRYGSFVLDNTVSNDLAVPVLYGQLKVAGNVIWQTDPDTTVSRVIGLCEGQINSISDIRANDIVINDTNTPGSSYTTYLGTGSQKADSRVDASIRPDLELHNLAYLALTLAASDQLKGGNPTITSVCQGLLVETWTGSVWNTTKAYSRNPVACVRDFLLNARYGLGLSKSNLNEQTFGDAYNYCEDMVDTASGPEARFRLDYIVDSERPAQDVINDILSTFGGYLVYAGSKIKLRINKIDPIVQYFGDGSTTKQNASFDPNNIVRDSFGWNMSSIDDRPNRIKIQWVDPSQNYVKVFTQVEDRIDQDDRGTIISKEIALLGITRQTQAARMAKLYMSIAKYAHVTLQFSARLESIQCEVGDVVAVTHQSAKFTRKLFRITTMQEAEDETIRFTCTEYNASIYDDHQGAAILTPTVPTGPNLYSPLSDVTGLTLLEDNFKQKDGVFATNILATWTAIPADQLMRLDRYLIRISSDGGTTYRDVAFVSSQKNSYRIVLGNVQTGTVFTVLVKTISDRGAESVGTSGNVTIQGKITPPTNVEDFNVVFAFDHIAMAWSAIDDEDLFGYEIRVGDENSIWETATIVTTENLGTRFDLFNFTRGTKIFFIKAIDNSSNYSENAAESSITITNIPDSNVVFSFDIFSRITQVPDPLQGLLSSDMDRVHTNNYNPTYNRPALQPKTELTHAEIQSTYATNLAFQNSGFVWGLENYVTTEETYETDVIDIGILTTGAFILDIQTFSSSNLGFVSVQIATSTDGVNFSSFSTFIAGQYSARYLKFKFLIQATDASTRVRLISAILTVDVPDVYQRFLNQAVGAGGSTITLSGFTAVKSIVITTVGGTPLIPRITDQSNLPNSFDMVLDIPGGGTSAGACNIYVSGY